MASSRMFSRREFAIGGACVFLAAAAPGLAWANADSIGALVKKVLGGENFEESRIKLEVPEAAENGLVVPVSVEVESPMTEADHVRSLHLFALDNPVPQVSSYTFTPANGKAAISTRVRLAKSQDLIAVAEMSDGTVHVAKAPISIMIGGCS
jgi:sulfur-oxidizing protein SoxY